MCLYPKIIENKKYLPNKKNNGKPPKPPDNRVKAVTIGCGECIECRRKKAREWQVRLTEEIKTDKRGIFVTLTFNNEAYERFDLANNSNNNSTHSRIIRLFTERWRKKHGKQPKRWLIPELGHQGTERLHFHGIIWTDLEQEKITDIWEYGLVGFGTWVDERTINYIIKYVTKPDEEHTDFKGKIYCSKGLGKGYKDGYNSTKNKYDESGTNECYRLNNGAKVNLPIYYRNKIYNEDEKERLWLEKLDKKERYVLGQRIDISTQEGQRNYINAVIAARKKNAKMGFKKQNYNQKRYNDDRERFGL